MAEPRLSNERVGELMSDMWKRRAAVDAAAIYLVWAIENMASDPCRATDELILALANSVEAYEHDV